jgi:hypothetical protein
MPIWTAGSWMRFRRDVLDLCVTGVPYFSMARRDGISRDVSLAAHFWRG